MQGKLGKWRKTSTKTQNSTKRYYQKNAKIAKGVGSIHW